MYQVIGRCLKKIINRINDAANGNGQTSNDNFYFVPNRVGTYADYLIPSEITANHHPNIGFILCNGMRLIFMILTI